MRCDGICVCVCTENNHFRKGSEIVSIENFSEMFVYSGDNLEDEMSFFRSYEASMCTIRKIIECTYLATSSFEFHYLFFLNFKSSFNLRILK